jgi:hypothetical protein
MKTLLRFKVKVLVYIEPDLQVGKESSQSDILYYVNTVRLISVAD